MIIFIVFIVVGFCSLYCRFVGQQLRCLWDCFKTTCGTAVSQLVRIVETTPTILTGNFCCRLTDCDSNLTTIFLMNYKYIIILLFLLSFSILPYPAFAHPSLDVNNGLKALEEGDFDKAESDLQKARFEDPDSYIVNYDLGIVSYRKRDYAKSIRFFAKASEVSKTIDEKFDAFYNMGNAAFKGYDFALAVDAYKNALSIKNNYQAEYNLKVAEKKLQEMLERMKKEQEQQQQQNQQQQPNQDNKQNQNQNNEQNKDNSQKSDSNNSQKQKDNQSQDQQKQDNQEQQGQDQQKQEGQNQQNQQGQQEQQSSENNSERNQQASEYKDNESQDQEQKDGQNSNNSEENKEKEEQNQEQKQASNSEEKDSENQQNQEQQGSEQKDEQSENQDNQKEQSAQSSEEQKENESQNDDKQKEAQAPINEEKIAPEEDRRDVKMTEDKGKVSRPEASQKARAMKNIRLKKDDVEAYLKQMEQRENEYQKYYRINNIEEKDPSELSPEDLKEWIKVRTRKREKRINNEQDW